MVSTCDLIFKFLTNKLKSAPYKYLNLLKFINYFKIINKYKK